jgi:hypothetical protein
MRLSMTLPEGWGPVVSGAEGLLEFAELGPAAALLIVAPTTEPRLRLYYGPLLPVPLAGESESFIERVLADGVRPGEKLVIKRRGPNQTVSGYPMLLVHSTLEDAGGATVEARLTAFYNLLSVNAIALARLRTDGNQAPILELYQHHEESLNTLLRSAAPDWEAGVCSIAALYEGMPNLWERK